MWGSLLIGALARPWARQVVALALAALTITLFILNVRRTAERAGRAAERLDQLERHDAIQRQMLDQLERHDAIQRQMLEAASRRPRSRDDLVDRLRGGAF